MRLIFCSTILQFKIVLIFCFKLFINKVMIDNIIINKYFNLDLIFLK